jgi:hypothetical protein
MSLELESTSPRRPPTPINLPVHQWQPFNPNLFRAVPVQDHYIESARLLDDRRSAAGWPSNDRRGGIDLPSSLTLCAAVALWTVIIGVVGIMYWQFSSSLASAQTAMQPYFGEAINRTMSILHNVDDSSIGAADMVESAQTLTDRAVPAMQLALNQTAAMITRLEKLAANPVLQISMNSGTPG